MTLSFRLAPHAAAATVPVDVPVLTMMKNGGGWQLVMATGWNSKRIAVTGRGAR